MSGMKRPLKPDDQMVALYVGKCSNPECKNPDCRELFLAIRNPEVKPNPSIPDELMATLRIPRGSIPGLVRALMTYYCDTMNEDEIGKVEQEFNP